VSVRAAIEPSPVDTRRCCYPERRDPQQDPKRWQWLRRLTLELAISCGHGSTLKGHHAHSHRIWCACQTTRQPRTRQQKPAVHQRSSKQRPIDSCARQRSTAHSASRALLACTRAHAPALLCTAHSSITPVPSIKTCCCMLHAARSLPATARLPLWVMENHRTAQAGSRLSSSRSRTRHQNNSSPRSKT
jgi:hypothetical protein